MRKSFHRKRLFFFLSFFLFSGNLMNQGMVLIQNLEQIWGGLIHDPFLFFFSFFNGLTDSAPGLCSKGLIQNPLKSLLTDYSVL